ncbi:TraB/GumN family protein [Sphingomonas aracearum]|uniref:TraB/GumN family protein n=1 Tax=Sphingomonas aracearum TaxID=2283317 RepID=UPI0015F045BE|nr:TraB/GumN family protein [Sphingomonas aracearum]
MEAHPALYEVRDADTVIWLLGTIHLLPADVHWRTPAIKQAIDSADTLVTEIPFTADDSAMARFTAAGQASGLPPLAARTIDPAALARALTTADLAPDALDGWKTWAAALHLAALATRSVAADREHGVEAVLAADFAGRPRQALETDHQQFAIFDALPEPTQRALLAGAVRGVTRDGADYRAELAAWSAGNPARIAAAVEPELAASPALRDALLTRRDARWAAWLSRRMGPPGRVLVAVGAGHVAGLVERLRARGFRVRRVA